MRKSWIVLTVLLVFAFGSPVSASPIRFDKDCNVEVTYLGTDAVYSNYFGWVSGTPPSGTLNPLGQGHVTQPGSIFPIGVREANENTILYIKTDENNIFYSDPKIANRDGIEHVRVVPIDSNGYIVSVGFEDLLGGGDKDFNDIYLEISCRPIIHPPSVPEFPTAALPAVMIVGMLGMVLLIKRTVEH